MDVSKKSVILTVHHCHKPSEFTPTKHLVTLDDMGQSFNLFHILCI
jgi:hypothetical protein